MSINFHLQNTTAGALQKAYPDVEIALFEEYPNICDELCNDEDDHYWYGGYFTHDRGYCKMKSSVPYVNMSNSNARYVLNDILGLDTHEYCGDLTDLKLARASCMLHTHPDCYYGITELKKLIDIAIENNYTIYWA